MQPLKAIFRAAQRDRLIAFNPCEGLRLPSVERHEVVPLERDAVLALIEALPERYRGLGIVGVGAGLRIGEALGITVESVDFLRRQIRVTQQISPSSKEAPHLVGPKTRASRRTIPVGDFVLFGLSAHRERYEPGEFGLLFAMPDGSPIRRQRFGEVWRAATGKARMPGTNFHMLRHTYASLLIDAGESVKTVQARLGHASAVETLNTYAHLWPDSEDRTRAAVDAVLRDAACVRTVSRPVAGGTRSEV